MQLPRRRAHGQELTTVDHLTELRTRIFGAGVTVTTTIETIPLLLLFEASIWLAVAFERRWFEPAVSAEAA
ncbi:MAG TPA: hypothetical protein VFA97_02660 [Gaiellaceae bacterium]|nr:hypothetical protein [Gaiellaceae bacterium]